MQTVFPPARAHGGPGRFAFDPRAHLTEHSPLAQPKHADRLLAQWSRHWNLQRPVLLEKSPPNLIRTRFLQHMFSNSRFLMVLRHPLAVALATQKWCNDPVERLIEHWLTAHAIFNQDRPFLSRVLVVRYENLVAQFDQTMKSMYEFLDLSPMPAGVTIDPESNQRYFESWRKHSRGWRHALRRRRMARHLEPRVRDHGYSLVDLSVGS